MKFEHNKETTTKSNMSKPNTPQFNISKNISVTPAPAFVTPTFVAPMKHGLHVGQAGVNLNFEHNKNFSTYVGGQATRIQSFRNGGMTNYGANVGFRLGL